jgi:hypothetical protein
MTIPGPRHTTALNRPRTWSTSFAAVLVSATVCLGLVGSAIALATPSAPTCQSGQTLFASGAVRAFKVTETNENQEAFVCVSSSAEPVVIDNPGPAIEVDVGDFHIRGTHLGFEIYDTGLGAGGGTDLVLGWVDLQTGELALDPLNVDGNSMRTLLPDYLISYAFAPDGTMAVIAGASCEVVAVLPIRAKPLDNAYRLGRPQILFTAHAGGLIHWSIAITATTVTWRTINGAKRSLPRSGGSTTTTPPSGGGC